MPVPRSVTDSFRTDDSAAGDAPPAFSFAHACHGNGKAVGAVRMLMKVCDAVGRRHAGTAALMLSPVCKTKSLLSNTRAPQPQLPSQRLILGLAGGCVRVALLQRRPFESLLQPRHQVPTALVQRHTRHAHT